MAQAGGGRVTETGLSVGTPHYMSPEQATGDRDVDPRTDVYALGCVLYEMLVGQPPYTGVSAQAVLAQILTGDAPAPTEVRVSIPPNVDAAIRKSLEKLPADRFTTAQDFSQALGDAGFRHGEAAGVGVASPSGPWKIVSGALAAVAIAASSVAAWSLLRPEPQTVTAVPFRTTLSGFDVAVGGGNRFAISPDGSVIAARRDSEGENLYLRRSGELEFREIPGTEGASNHTFSPDGDWLAFEQLGQIVRTQVSGGPSLPVVSGLRPHWGTDELIVFDSPEGGLYIVAPSGGEPRLILGGDSLVASRSFLLPDGEAVVFQEGSSLETRRLMLVEIESGVTRDLGITGNDPQYLPTGHLVYGHPNQALMAVPFDLESHSVTGDPVTVLPDLAVYVGGATQFQVSETGTALYVEGSSLVGTTERLLVVDLDGTEEALPLAPRRIRTVSWAPDGQSVAYSDALQSGIRHDVYTYYVTLGTTPRQVTFEGGNRYGVFSPDGTQIAFSSAREGTEGFDLFVKTLNEDVLARSVIMVEGTQEPTQWPLDTLIVFESGPGVPAGNRDLWTLNLSDPDNPRAEAYLSSEARLSSIKVSRDGTLAAYHSNESGANEVYIRSFPDPGERTPVSQRGGVAPSWSPDGNTVYYWRNESPGVLTFMAARIQRQPTPVVLSRDSLFTLSRVALSSGGENVVAYDLNAEGERLIVAQSAIGTTAAESATEPDRLILVTNFFEELRQVVPDY